MREVSSELLWPFRPFASGPTAAACRRRASRLLCRAPLLLALALVFVAVLRQLAAGSLEAFAAPATTATRRVFVQMGQNGKELIVDQTFASLYRPGKVTTNCVWDALAAPILAMPPEQRQSSDLRILILGLGGGSVARILRELAPQATIVGVEFDPAVVEAARDHFNLDDLGVDVVIGDALQYLKEGHGLFDFIVDDVFIGLGDSVRKPPWAKEGLQLAAQKLTPDGVLVGNSISESRLVSSTMHELGCGNLVEVTVQGYQNRIYGGCRSRNLNALALKLSMAKSDVMAESLDVLGFADA
eukprot:TRINITY_DN14766_c0_g1_i1.p1 TRINITY_DN14766_c0_g1~~TRINITY_DN14766_c0_g1_i1.p1  ORF type:complete len:300 (-),score=54.77 TRINITY_DN14766_c0_g1_i1:348-1247(-)